MPVQGETIEVRHGSLSLEPAPCNASVHLDIREISLPTNCAVSTTFRGSSQQSQQAALLETCCTLIVSGAHNRRRDFGSCPPKAGFGRRFFLHACMSVAAAVRRSCSQGQPAANRPRASTCRATSSFPGLLSILGCCFQPHARPGFGVNSQLASIGRQCHMFHGTSFCYGGSHPAAIYA